MRCLDRGECHRGRTPGHPEAESVESTAPRSWGASQVKGSGRRWKACHRAIRITEPGLSNNRLRSRLALRSRSDLDRWDASGVRLVITLVIKGGGAMQIWPVQDAKARFSEFLEKCLTEGPQMVTKRGSEAAVLVPADEWRRLQASARRSLKELLLSDEARAEIPVPPRGKARRRDPSALR